MATLRYLPEVLREAAHAGGWYDREAGRDTGAAFRLAVEEALKQIAAHPRRFPPYLHGTHRFLMKRFPYSVVYLIESEAEIVIVAIAHQRRQPAFWKGRLPRDE